MKRLALVLGFVLVFLPLAAAPTSVRPALWHIAGDKGRIVLMGSVHVLPPGTQWQTPDVRRAIDAADVFVFEVPTDEATAATIAQAIAQRGRLPQGQTLHGLLSDEGRRSLDAALTRLGWPSASVDTLRPWLATLVIDRALMESLNQTAPGPDFTLADQARRSGKDLRYLETAEAQLAILAPADPKVEIEYFEAGLKEFDGAKEDVDRLTAAWGAGDVATVAALVDKEFGAYPKAKAFFLDDRTKAWAETLAAMLHENKTFFVVVGAAHVVGKTGLPALLRAKGFIVEGP